MQKGFEGRELKARNTSFLCVAPRLRVGARRNPIRGTKLVKFFKSMKKLESLKALKEKVDKEIKDFLEEVIKEARGRDKFIAEELEYVKKVILSGGKRLRPAFMYYGYLASNGKEKEKIIKASVSVELIHCFLLIHDDVVDRDKKRHNLDTLNFRYSKIGKKLFKIDDGDHFGDSMAIIMGDMINALGNKVLFDSKFKSDNIIKALSKLQEIVSYTVVGEAQDIYIEYKGKTTEKEVLKMYENKTAKYSIEGPLHLGAILAGAPEENLQGFSKYSIPLGIAFQIQDDILGIFGSEDRLGKTVGADIIEGKQTLLVVKAKEEASRNQLKVLNSLLGKKDLAKTEIKEFQKIIRETGALDYASDLAKNLIAKSKKELAKLRIKKESKDFLLEIADFMIERDL